MKVCEQCGLEIGTKDGESLCDACDAKELSRVTRNKARRERDQALRDCGLVKVRGALGGVYWE